MGKAPEKPRQVMGRYDKAHLYSPREAFLSHPWRFSSPEWTRQGPPEAGWPGGLLESFPPGIILPWSFLQATLDIHQHSPGQSPHPQGDFPPFPHLLSEPWVWIQAGILQDAPEGRWKDFPCPRGSRTGWFQAQPKVPSQIPCVHQEGFIHGLICDPCDCPQRTFRASCVIVPSEVLMATSAQISTSFGDTGKTPWIPSGQGQGQFGGAASVLAAALRVWDAPYHGLDCLGSSHPRVPQFPLC